MTRGRGAAVAAIALGSVVFGAACSSAGSGRPEPGPAAGPVSIEVSAALAPGATVVLELAADGTAPGSACATIDRLEDGGWRSTWWWVRSSPVAEPIASGDEVTCPAVGVALPARMTIAIPDGLAAGTWRLAYAAGEDLGAYIFEVP